MKKISRDWKAYHVFYHGSLDFLIQHCIKPLTKKLLSEGLAEKFFFIRYWEGGPHIRFRVNQFAEDSYKNEEVIISQIQKFLHEHPSECNVDERLIALQLKKFAKLENVSLNQLQIRMNNTVHKEVYVPEVDKYGGPVGLRISEEHFFYSSLFSFNLLETVDNQSDRFLLGIKVILSYLKAMNMRLNENINFLQHYTSIWLRYMEGDITKIKGYFYKKYLKQKNTIDKYVSNYLNVNNTSDIMLDWNVHLGETVKKLQESWDRKELVLNTETLKYINLPKKIVYIITNYIHMTNNRLGLKPHEEAYLSYIICCSLKTLRGYSECKSIID